MSVGERLKKARKAQGLSIDDIKNKSKIKKSYLEALENDNYKKLPGKVYTKVYIRGYAKIVGLEPQELLSEYENEKNADRKVSEKQSKEEKKDKSGSVLNHDNILKVILGIILILILLLLSYNMFFRSDQNQNNTAIDNSKTQLVQEESSNGNSNVEQENQNEVNSNNTESKNIENTNTTDVNSDNNTENETVNNNNGIDESENLNSVSSNEETNPDGNNTDQANNENESNEENTTNNELEDNNQSQEPLVEEQTKELTILAKEKSWLQVTVDGELKFQGFIKEDETMTHNGSDSIRLKIGNGIAVQVEYEGELMGPFGKRGEVIIKEFDIED